jgi:uncharacterized protein (TIGR00106 family)
MKRRIIAEISVVPLGTGSTSLSHFVAECISALEDEVQVSYQLTPMSTIVEGPLDKVIDIMKQLHEIPFNKGALRVLTTLKIDDRRDKEITMSSKVAAVLDKYASVKREKK